MFREFQSRRAVRIALFVVLLIFLAASYLDATTPLPA